MYSAPGLYTQFRSFPWRAAMFGKPYTFVAGLLISVVIVVVTTFYLRSETTRSHDQSLHAAESIASLIDHQIDRDFSKVGVFLRMIRNGRMLNHDSVDRQARSGTSELFRLFPEIEALVISDLNGKELGRFDRKDTDSINPQVWPIEKTNLSPMSDIRLTGPLRSPYSGQWVITLAIDLVTPSGEKEGYAFVSIQSSNYFQSVLSQPKLGALGAATIRTQDLSLIYRSVPPSDIEIGSKKTSQEIQDSFKYSPNEGQFIARTALDGIERVNAYRKIGPYPLYVIVGLATDENRKHWPLGESVIVGLTGLSVILLLTLSLTYAASAHRQQELNTRLSGEAQKLSAIFEACSESIHILDLHGGLIKANTAFYKLIGRDEHEAGINVTDWSPQNSPSIIEQFNAVLADSSAESKRVGSTFIRESGDRLQVEIGIKKFDFDGQPAICASARDITSERSNLEMLQNMLSEYRQLNDELEFRTRCCEVIQEESQPCLASTIPGMLIDWQELLLVFGAMQEKALVTTEGDYATLMERARKLLDTMVEVVHRAHHSRDFSSPLSP